jgi:cephalosporin hydroxylase
MTPQEQFKKECAEEIAAMGEDKAMAQKSLDWLDYVNRRKYSYHFEWLGRPIIQYPQDIVAMQEILFEVKPDLIIETGIAHGGSLIFMSSMLELIALCGGPKDAQILGIDIDIRAHNKAAIEAHPMAKRISMIQGSSIDPATVDKVKAFAKGKQRILVSLDSNHTHDHVLGELEAYAGLTSVGSYCVVFDTVVENLPKDMFSNRPWGPGNSPKSAVDLWLKTHPEFVLNKSIEDKIQITVAPGGFLKRIR